MDLCQLRYVLAVDDAGVFSEGAELVSSLGVWAALRLVSSECSGAQKRPAPTQAFAQWQ